METYNKSIKLVPIDLLGPDGSVELTPQDWHVRLLISGQQKPLPKEPDMPHERDSSYYPILGMGLRPSILL